MRDAIAESIVTRVLAEYERVSALPEPVPSRPGFYPSRPPLGGAEDGMEKSH